jgi:hypothetical protein
MEKNYQQKEGWDYDDLDCPECEEVIIIPQEKPEEEESDTVATM